MDIWTPERINQIQEWIPENITTCPPEYIRQIWQPLPASNITETSIKKIKEWTQQEINEKQLLHPHPIVWGLYGGIYLEHVILIWEISHPLSLSLRTINTTKLNVNSIYTTIPTDDDCRPWLLSLTFNMDNNDCCTKLSFSIINEHFIIYQGFMCHVSFLDANNVTIGCFDRNQQIDYNPAFFEPGAHILCKISYASNYYWPLNTSSDYLTTFFISKSNEIPPNDLLSVQCNWLVNSEYSRKTEYRSLGNFATNVLDYTIIFTLEISTTVDIDDILREYTLHIYIDQDEEERLNSPVNISGKCSIVFYDSLQNKQQKLFDITHFPQKLTYSLDTLRIFPWSIKMFTLTFVPLCHSTTIRN